MIFNNSHISLEDGAPPRIEDLITGLVSAAGLIIGFLMIVQAETIKLFIDLQTNADRQAIALDAIFRLMENWRKE